MLLKIQFIGWKKPFDAVKCSKLFSLAEYTFIRFQRRAHFDFEYDLRTLLLLFFSILVPIGLSIPEHGGEGF